MTSRPDPELEDDPRTRDEDESSNDKLPFVPNPDDPTPVGDTDQHSDVPSDAPDAD
jgi:hypothetical protein